MKYLEFKSLDEKVLYDKLDNGLEVFILRKKGYNTETARFFTNFGGLDTEFIPINEKDYVKVPAGIAHFLEHKLFEQEDGVPADEFYKNNGAYVNAFTNYKKTCYHFTCTSNFEKNLNYLLDFVQSPYFTDENVEKERGIIIEEAKMCLDDPARQFNEAILSNLFLALPFNQKVIGEVEDIKKITKEELYTCYNTFYHPSNMKLFVVTNKKEEDILNLVKENQSKKHFEKEFKITRKQYDEPLKVKNKYNIIKSRVNEKRICYSVKLDINKFKYSKAEIINSIDIYLEYLIGGLSKFNLDLKTSNIINGDVSYNIQFEDKYLFIKIYACVNEEEKFIKLLEEELNSNKISNEEDFLNLKKSIISSLFYNLNTVDGTMNFLYGEYNFYDEVNPENIELERNLTYDTFKKVVNLLTYDNNSITLLVPYE